MKRSVLLLVVCLLVFMPSCNFVKKKGWFGGKKADTLLVWQARQDNLRRADSIAKIAEFEAAVERARLDSINRVEQEKAAYAARFKYHIIVGSFITPEYARLFQEQMKKNGYNSQILKKPDSKFELISAEAHESLRKSVERLVQFRDTVAYDAWIYIKQ
jgi:hypothetical protein